MSTLRLLFAGFLLAFAFASAQASGLEPYDLRCDAAENPLGIDSAPPRFSWKLRSGERGERQTAWQVRVASTPEDLAKDAGGIWNSGRVAGDEQLYVPYAGRVLSSFARVFWQVRVWDHNGNASAWTEPATWTMGVLSPADWLAHWITHPVELTRARSHLGFHSEETRDPDTAKWVQLDVGAVRPLDEIRLHALRHTVAERLGFPRRFKIEVADEPSFAAPRMVLDYTAGDHGSEWSNDFILPLRGVAARYLRFTATRLRMSDEGTASLALSQIEVMSAGQNVARGVPVTASDSWETGPWSAASVVDGLENTGAQPDTNSTLLLRREFAVRPALKRAIVNVCGLGEYELVINGHRVGDQILSPGWTETTKTCLYDTYDVTALMRAGPNAAGLTVAGGMYRVPDSDHRYIKFTSPLRPLVAIAQLRLEYADGSSETVGTDDRWRAARGPVTYAHVYGGEDYDARLEPHGWTSPGFDDTAWTPAVAAAGPGGVLRGNSHAAPPLGKFDVLKPVAQKELSAGVTVYDLGQNAALIPRLRVRGSAGAMVRIIPAELVKTDGEIERGSVGGGKAWWAYTLAGSGDAPKAEEWSPQFFYQGCRYLQVELTAPAGAALPIVESIEGVVVHSTSAPVGGFACSNDLFNRVHTLVRWAQCSNLMSVLTDCPHRERLGWLEQYHLNGPSLRYEWDLARLYHKCFGDMADAQLANGMVPDIAPEYTVLPDGFRDSPEWGSALVLAAWQQFEWTGDDAPLRQYYPAMRRYLDYLKSRSTDRIVSHGLGDWYDIGPKPPGIAQLTPIALTATAFYYLDTVTVAAIARRIGETADAERYAAEAAKIRTAFNAKFFDAKAGSYATGSQTAQALPLYAGLVEPAHAGSVFDALVHDVRARGNALTAGDVGYRYLLRALADGGRSDVVFDMNNQSEKPGYGYQLAHGATSLTEAWDAGRSSSQNHFMLGQIIEWFYHDLAGLGFEPGTPGFQRVVIRPRPVGDIAWARAAYESPRGKIVSSWKHADGRFTLEVEIPPGATAVVFVPNASSGSVKEGDIPVGQSPGVRHVRDDDGCGIYSIGSGRYTFSAPWPPAGTQPVSP